MDIKIWGKKKFPLTLITLLIAVILITAGCSGGGGGATLSSDTTGTSGDTSGSTGDTSGTSGGTTGGTTAAKATLSGTLLSSSSSSGSSLFKKLKKSAAATSSLPVSGATVLCFDTDSVSTAATGTSTTNSSGTWTMDVSEGSYVCFGVYIDLATLTIKTTKMDDIAAIAGEAVSVGAATVESDTTSPSIVSVLADNTADTSLSDGDPDPLFEASEVLPTQALAVIFSEAMNTSTMAVGTGVVLKDSAGTTVETTLSFNGQGTEFRYTPNSPLTAGSSYTLYISNKVKDLSNNGINDPDSDGVVALARITVTDQVDAFSYLSSSPKDADTGVSVYKDLTVAFNRPADFVSFKDHTTIVPALSGRFEPSGDGVSFIHSTPFAANTEYTVTIGSDVEDLAGNKLGSAKTLKFNTGAGVDANSVSGFDAGGGAADDLLAIVANITKAELAIDNQDIVTFGSFFAPDFTMTEKKCEFNPDAGMTGTTGGTGTVSGPKLAKEGVLIMDASAPGPGPAPSGDGMMPPPGEVCTTNTFTLADFLANMKKDMQEDRNMAKGFGEVQRLMLTNSVGSKMSVEHFNSEFDADRSPIGEDMYVGFPNRREGVDFVNSEIDVPDAMSPNGTRREFVTYRLSGECRDLTTASEEAGAGEVIATYHYWNQQTQRDEMKTRICPVYDGDSNSTNSWASDDEVYPADWTGPKNVWEDNDQDCSPGMWDCQNEDGLISLQDTDANGIADKAVRYYETVTVDQYNNMLRTAHEDVITSALVSAGGLNVAAAMQVAANNHWDIEGVDNDGDSRINYFNPNDHSQGGYIDRHINEDWPNGMDDDNDGKIDEDNDGMGNNPQPIDGDSDLTNDPMPHSDWNLANNGDVVSNDEFWAQTYLIIDPLFSPNGAQWTDADGTVYYEIAGPRGWPYPYAAGQDGKPWSGDEFDQNNGPDLNNHVFTWADVSILGKVYFRNDDKSGGAFLDNDRNVYLDLTAAGFNIESGVITNPTERVQSGEKAAAIFRWDSTGHLSNNNGLSIDWMNVRPLMDHIDYNADGDWNVGTNPAVGLRRVPHDRATGGVMSTADYLALGWDTWRVSNDLQLVANPDVVWDVEADWARMEGDDDGDGQFNEDGLYSDYFNNDGSLKVCLTQANYPCMVQDATTGQLVLYKEDGTSTTSFDISDGVDNNGNGEVDEVEAFDDDGDGAVDEDPPGDPNDADGNGDTTAPYDDDGDGRKDEDPVSYERDRMNDHGQWAKVYQGTTDAVVDMFYLSRHTGLEVADIVIDEAGSKATAIVNLVNTETWTPHNPWGDDFNRDGEPDDVNTWTETMVFDMEKFSSKWLVTSITPVDSLEDYAQQVASGDIKQFGGEVARLKMISPAGDPMTGPPANQTVTPTFVWDDSEVSGAIGSYMIHIEEITEAMATAGGQPTTVMMLSIAASDVITDPATGARSFTLGSGGTDLTAAVLLAFADDSHFPFTTALTALADGKAYSWGILAFEENQADLATAFASGKPEPLADSFEPMMFATTGLPTYLAMPAFGTTGSKGSLAKVKVGGVEYHAIPSNIAPHLYGSSIDSRDSDNAGHAPSSVDPRSRR